MSMISAVRDYIKTYSGLTSGSGVWVDSVGPGPVDYGVIPLPGARVLSEYINGSSQREFPFAFRAVLSTADNLTRLQNNGFYESFADWLESQSKAGVFPTLGSGKQAELVEATGWGYLFEDGAKAGTYQINCRVVYQQD